MNMHCTEDEVLQLALGVLGGRTESRIRSHVGSCAHCAAHLKAVEATLVALGKCEPVVSMPPPDLGVARDRTPAPREVSKSSPHRNAGKQESINGIRPGVWVRFAAVLFVGMGIGYAASGLFHRTEPTVVRQLVAPRDSVLDAGEFTPCSVDQLQRR